jgi:hypothetical protein
MSAIVQQDATIYSSLYLCKIHPSSGAHITVITASGAGQTVSATFRSRAAVETTAP